MADFGTGNDHRLGRMLLTVGACEKCVEISKTAECVAVRVRPSFDKNEKACRAGKDNLLSFTRHTCFYFCSNLGRTRTNKTHTFCGFVKFKQFEPVPTERSILPTRWSFPVPHFHFAPAPFYLHISQFSFTKKVLK